MWRRLASLTTRFGLLLVSAQTAFRIFCEIPDQSFNFFGALGCFGVWRAGMQSVAPRIYSARIDRPHGAISDRIPARRNP
jgi:hypothetical protein